MEPDLEILRRMRALPWPYSNADEPAVAILTERIEEAGRRTGLITYSDLVDGIEFHLQVLGDRTDLDFRNGLHRKILGDFLGYISLGSYAAHGFMASVLVVGKDSTQPSQLFFEWMRELEAIPDLQEDNVLPFWVEQMNAAMQYYRGGS